MQNAETVTSPPPITSTEKPKSGFGPDSKSVLVYYLNGWIVFGGIFNWWSRNVLLTSADFEILINFAVAFGLFLPLVAWSIHNAILFEVMKKNPKADLTSKMCIAFMGSLIFAIPALMISIYIYSHTSSSPLKSRSICETLFFGGGVLGTLGILMGPSLYYSDITNFETLKAETCVENWILGKAQNAIIIQACRDDIDRKVRWALLTLNPLMMWLKWAIIVVGIIIALKLIFIVMTPMKSNKKT